MTVTKYIPTPQTSDYSCLENLRESSLDLSLIHCGKKDYHAGQMEEHRHAAYMLYFVLNGRGNYQIQNQSFSLAAGDCFLAFPSIDYSFQADPETPWSLAWIGFRGILAENILNHAGFSSTNLIRLVPNREHILHYISQILQHSQLTLINDLKRHSILTDFMAYLIEKYEETKPDPLPIPSYYNQNIYVNHAIEHIRISYAQPITVQSIAQFIGISRTHLNNCFQKELGISIQKFLIDFRLYQASFLLTSTSLQVQEIAEKVGYADSLSFSKAFKKKFLLSPSHYRLNNEAKNQQKYDNLI